MTQPDSPEAVFAAAQSAMDAGDWAACFAVMSTKDLRRLAAMGLAALLAADGGAALADHGVDLALLRSAIDASDRVAASAAAPWADMPPAERAAWSTAHRDLVAAHEAATEAAVKSVGDLPQLVAAIERHRRATEGGGSVSSRLFVGDTLVEVAVEGSTARGTRRHANGTTDPVAFVKERGGWRVSIFGR